MLVFEVPNPTQQLLFTQAELYPSPDKKYLFENLSREAPLLGMAEATSFAKATLPK
jgi:hypothetical protein